MKVECVNKIAIAACVDESDRNSTLSETRNILIVCTFDNSIIMSNQ